MAIQPHIDAKGQLIGVFITIEDWKRLKQECPDLQGKFFLDLQVLNMIVFQKAINDLPKSFDFERFMKRKRW